MAHPTVTFRKASYLGELLLPGRESAAMLLDDLLESLLLRLLGEVEPEFHQDRAVIGEHSLELVDARELRLELCAPDPLVRAGDDGLRVPERTGSQSSPVAA
jgi:hypothetical protein